MDMRSAINLRQAICAILAQLDCKVRKKENAREREKEREREKASERERERERKRASERERERERERREIDRSTILFLFYQNMYRK